LGALQELGGGMGEGFQVESKYSPRAARY